MTKSRKSLGGGAVLLAALAPRAGVAQGTMDSLRELGFDPSYLYYAAGAGVLLIVCWLFMVVAAKGRRSRAEQALSGLTSIDMSGLRSKGLLTDEELAKVRQAMSRQVTRQLGQDAEQKRVVTHTARTVHFPAKGGSRIRDAELALLTDLDVQRLEAIADAKGAVVEQSSKAEMSGPSEKSESDDPFAPIESSLPEIGSETEVVLPPEVQKMANDGLISPEELAKIKDRVRAQARAQQNKPGV